MSTKIDPAQRVPRAAARAARRRARGHRLAVAHLRAARLRQHRDPRGRAAGPAGQGRRDRQGDLRPAPAAGGRGATRTPGWACTSTSPCRSPATCWRTPASWSSRSAATRSSRPGAASAPRRAATASSPRPTSTSSAATSSPFHHDVEVVRVMVEALGALPLPPRVVPGQQPQADPGLLPRPRHRRRHRPRSGSSTSSTSCRPRRSPSCWSSRPARRPSRPSSACGWPTIRVADTSFVEQVRALGVEDELLETAWPSSPPSIEGCAARHRDRVTVEANLRIARGLDYYTGTVFEIFMAATSASSRSAAAAATTRSPATADDLPRRRRLVRRLPHAGAAARRRRARGQPAGAERGAGRRDRRGVAAGQRRGRRRACAPAASPARWRPTPQKFGKQIRYAERRGIPFVWFPERRRDGHEVKDIRSGDQVAADPATWTPPSEDLRPQRHPPRSRPVIRTHDAGALRAEHVGQTVTLAGWVASRRDHGGVAFLDLREASGVVQVVVRDEEVAHSLRSEYCLKVTGEVVRAPGGQREPQPRRPARSRSSPTDVEVLSAAAPLPFPIDDAHRRSARRRGSSTATSTCAAPAPTTRSACAARSTRPPATSSTATTSSRSRPRR